MEQTKHILHRGDIFLNKWAGWLSLFVYIRTAGRLCHGIGMAKFHGKWKISKASYYKQDLEYDAEHFPLVGKINIQKMWTETILYHLSDKNFLDNYLEDGHQKN